MADTAPLPAQLVVGPLVERLRVARGEAAALASWQRAAEERPEDFLAALLRALGERRGGALESSVERFEAYADLVTGQLARRRFVLAERTAVSERHVTMAELDARASALAATWAEQGVAVGASLAFVMGAGFDATVALLAALRLGACVTWVAPKGKVYVMNRLVVLEPEHVVTAAAMKPHLGDFGARALPLEPTRSAKDGPSRGHAYQKGEAVFRLFSPYAKEPFDLFELDGPEVLGALARMVFFGLEGDANDVLVWPELDEATHEPLVTLGALFGGIARVHCKLDELVGHPEWLAGWKATLLGVGPVLREELLRDGPEKWRGIRAWLRDCAEPFDFDRTQALAVRVEPAKWRRTDLLHVAAGGGLLAFGVTGMAASHALMLPAFGLRWALLDPVGSGKPASGGMGLLARMAGEEPERGAACFAVAKQGAAWLLAGSTNRGRWGRTFPSFEVRQAARKLPFVEEVDVVLEARGIHDASVTLVAFVDPCVGSVDRHRAAWTKALREAIAFDVGEEFVPEAFSFVPVRPRYDEEGAFASAWLGTEWLTGALQQKANDPMYTLLARVARMFAPPKGD